MGDFYTDNDTGVCAWLRELVRAGELPDGEVYEKPVQELSTELIFRFRRVHLFAGIGGWAYALELAGWPITRPVWTGSCPCQPFSTAGKRKGTSDSRHLWPDMLRLVAECRPPTIFGEQVASRLGREWLAGIRADLEALGYVVGAADLCAAGVGAPIRQRSFWVADLCGPRLEGRPQQPAREELPTTERSCNVGGMEPATSDGREQRPQWGEASGASNGLVDAERFAGSGQREPEREAEGRASYGWDNSSYVHCADGKTRRIESGSFPLVDGFPGRVGLLRGYGNAIVPQVAASFVRAFLELDSY